ncbi:hypothetical protein AB6A40_004833 [Gnathostoma spinigerum]|uniref:Uncharacterized protein n=1 Tax=Gnathostoma spinigerum TaxID=75299 RepID=A0ABD6ELD8_9BILA
MSKSPSTSVTMDDDQQPSTSKRRAVEWGSYMALKKAKLLYQLDETRNELTKTSKIFEGVSVFVNGYTGQNSVFSTV